MVTKEGKTPRHRRRTLGIVAAVVAVMLVAGLVSWRAGWLDSLPFVGKDAKPGVFQVGKDGGTYKLPSGGSIVVPKGAVEKPTTLTVAAPHELKANEAAPLQGVRQGGLAFDVSLTRGTTRDIQPAKNKPLVLTLPLKPPGKAHALAYTALPGGTYALLPSRAADANHLTIQLPHLSAKYVTYVTDEQLLEGFNADPVKRSKGKCPQNMTIDGVKVKIDPDGSRGWSPNKGDSAIFACLAKSPDNAQYARLNVVNMVGFVLSVAKTDNMRVAASRGDLDEELTKYFAKFFADSKTTAYLGRGGKLVGSIDVNSLYDQDAIMELQASFGTFASESLVKLFGLAVEALTGKGVSNETLELLSKAVRGQGMVSCLQNSLSPLTGKSSLPDVVNAGAGCFGTLFGEIANLVGVDKLLWRIGWVGDALKAIADTAISAANGVKLTLANTLRVAVTAEPPPCPSDAVYVSLLRPQYEREAKQAGTYLKKIVVNRGPGDHCQGGWAKSAVGVHSGDWQKMNPLGFGVLLHYQNGAWTLASAEQDMSDSPVCKESATPAFVRNWLSCHD